MYEELVKQQRKEIAKLTLEKQRQIIKLYDGAIKGIAEKVEKAFIEDDDTGITFNIVYKKELEKAKAELKKELGMLVGGAIEEGAEIGTKAEKETMVKLFEMSGLYVGDDFEHLFGQVQENVVKNIISGDLYKDKKTLSDRIWDYGENFEKDIQYIVNQGIFEKKSAVELAEDLEQFVKEPAKRYWDWGKAYPELVGKQVEYNAMRMARTSINHAYQTASIQSSQANPFIEGIEWQSALIHGRTCEVCQERHGQVFKKDDVPLDHPNGLCTMLPVIEKSLEEVADELRDWIDGEDNPALDDWYLKYGEYFETGDLSRVVAMDLNKEKDHLFKYAKFEYGGDSFTVQELLGMEVETSDIWYAITDYTDKLSNKEAEEKLVEYLKGKTGEGIMDISLVEGVNFIDRRGNDIRNIKDELDKIYKHIYKEKLTALDIDAIETYQSIDYENINNYLRGKTNRISAGLNETIKILTGTIEKVRLEEDMILARGTTTSWLQGLDWEDLKVGDVLIDDGFLSASVNGKKAKQFARRKGERAILADVKVLRGTSAVFVDTAVDDGWEAEIIFKPGSKFIIEEKWIEDGVKRLKGVIRSE